MIFNIALILGGYFLFVKWIMWITRPLPLYRLKDKVNDNNATI